MMYTCDQDHDCVVVWEAGIGKQSCPMCVLQSDYEAVDNDNLKLTDYVRELEAAMAETEKINNIKVAVKAMGRKFK